MELVRITDGSWSGNSPTLLKGTDARGGYYVKGYAVTDPAELADAGGLGDGEALVWVNDDTIDGKGVTRITDDQFAGQLATANHELFRVESHPSPKLTEEAEDFARFVAGNPTPPEDMAWYQPWVEQVREWASTGVTITRVRIMQEPPSRYQQWLLWGGPFFGSIGEKIRYMSASMAKHIGLDDDEWWMIDGIKVITTELTADGEPGPKTLITDPDRVEVYRMMRHLALDNSTAEYTY